jgi:hypothetical protein
MSDSERELRASLYTGENDRTILKKLGDGTDGSVWQTTISTAIKACEDLPRYSTERDCYRLFLEKGVTQICGYSIPGLVGYSDELMVIEIEMVQPPYILDFGKASLYRLPPHYTDEDIAELYAERKLLFDDEWPTIRSILARLRGYGVYHLDPRPHNIQPANWNPSLD